MKELIVGLYQMEIATSKIDDNLEKVTQISDAELKKISSLKTPNNVLALFKIPEGEAVEDIVIDADTGEILEGKRY